MRREATATAPTIDEAIEAARLELGISDEIDVEIEIIDQPEKKVLGLFGGKPAKVTLSYDDGKKEEKPKRDKKPAPKAEKKAEKKPAPAKKAVKIEEKPVKKDKKVKKENIVPETVDVNKTQILSEALPEADSDFTILLSNKEADYKVVIQDINDKMRVFSYPLIDNSVIVGRSSEAGAQIALNYNNSISKKHCKISNINGRFFVEDLGSANGTWVNGLRINARTEFNNGAKLKFGNLEVVVSVEKLD